MIVVNAGSGGVRTISGALINQGQIVVASNTALNISGVYQAQGGTILGPGYLVNCTLQETAAPATPSTIVVAGKGVTLATDNLAGYTLWVQGSDHGGDAVLQIGPGVSNRGAILLQSANNTYQSDIATGSATLTNLGTIRSGGGSGGLRLITGTLDNQATIDATADYVDISGVYQAQGGTILGNGYLVNCSLQETAAPASASTILVAGKNVTLATDNLAGYTLWVQGSDHGGDAILQLGGSLANRGAILLQSANNTYQSDIATGSNTLTNLGTISSGGGSGGVRSINGTLNNQATVNATADYVDISGVYQAQGGTILGNGYLVNCSLQETVAPASASTILVAGKGVTLATDNLAGYTLWVQGSDHGRDAVLQLGPGVSNRGTILLQSVNNTYQSDIATGSNTLTNLGTISSGGGSGGVRSISGTLDNQATIDATVDYVDISGVYQAQGGTILGNGYLVNCSLQETAAPASASTILVAGKGVTLATDNLAGYTVWSQGSDHGGDAVLNIGAGVTNRGAILLQSVNNTYQSDMAIGPYTLTNLGTISSAQGSGGVRSITGRIVNDGSVVAGAGTWLSVTGGGYEFDQESGTIEGDGTFTVTGGLMRFDGGTTIGDVGVYNGQLTVAVTASQAATVRA